MAYLKELFQKETTKRILFFVGLVFFFYVIRSMFNLFLLTFLFTFLVNSFQNFILKRFKNVSPVKEKFITILLYVTIGSTIVLMIVKFIPVFIDQTVAIIDQFTDIFNSDSSNIKKYIVPMIEQIDLRNYIKSGVGATLQLATNIGTWSIDIFIAFMLSMFFILEKKKVLMFLKRFEQSKISGIYKYMSYFGQSFLNSFGKVLQAQILIAMANSLLSVIMLYILGFPKLLSLGIMIFFLSLIPVAGVIISLVPLSILAFNIGGFTKVISIIIMILGIHGFESYALNPKLMSAKVELPIFFTFVILIVSEHFIGVWGLLIGIPIVMFILDLLDVKKS